MDTPRPHRWRRRVATRRAGARRALAWGAFAGLVAGVAAQLAVSTGAQGDLVGLARFALVFPVGVYVLWWIALPGLSLGERRATSSTSATSTDELAERLRTIEESFDVAARPQTGRTSFDLGESAKRATYRASIRRDAIDPTGAAEQFGFGNGRASRQRRLR